MKPRLVLWGNNAQDEKILVALELMAEENQIKIRTFADTVVTDDFYEKSMREEWRKGKEVEMPEHKTEIRDLKAADSLLPEHIKVQRTDLVERKQLEWQVLVLGAKMNAQFQSELDALKDKVERLDSYDRSVWENLKGFWSKVQKNVREGMLSRKYERELRKTTDGLFSQMKELRKKMDEEFRTKAQKHFNEFSETLENLEKRITEGTKLNAVFNELKGLQRKFHNTKFTRDLREKVWQRMDKAFKDVKQKKYGTSSENNPTQKGRKNYESTPLGRLNRRYDGLLKAIERSERGLKKDQKDLEFEQRRIERTDGQLEAQIRQAKIKMIEQRITSKEQKLKDLYKTQEQLKKKRAQLEEKERLEKIRKEKEAEAKAKIQEKVNQTTENLDPALEEKAKAAAEKIKKAKQQKAQNQNHAENGLPIVPPLISDESSPLDETEKEEDLFENIKNKTLGAIEHIAGDLEPYIEKGKEIVDEIVEEIKEETTEFIDDTKKTLEPYMEKGKDVVDEIREETSEFMDEGKEKLSDFFDDNDDDNNK